MTVHKASARLLAADGREIGAGRAYIHLRQAAAEVQSAQGTLSLDWSDDDAPTHELRLALEDGPLLALQVQSDKLSGCINGRVLRYTTRWPGVAAP